MTDDLRFDIIMNIGVLSDRQQTLPVDPRVAGLVERVYVQLQAFVLADHLLRVLVSVERVHQDERDVTFVRFVQMLEKKRNFYLDMFRTSANKKP